MTGELPSFFKETIEAMLNLCLTVYFDLVGFSNLHYHCLAQKDFKSC